MDRTTLLIVEDDCDLREVLALAAEARGYQVIAAGTIAEAAAVDAALAVAIVDLALADGSGLDVLRDLRARVPDVEVLVISGNGSLRAAIESYDMAAFAFVQKPFDLEQLFATVGRAIEHRRMILANRRLVWELRLINEVNEDLRRSLDARVLVEGTLRRLVQGLDASCGSVRLVSVPGRDSGEEVHIGPAWAVEGWARVPHLPRPDQQALASRTVVLVPDLHAVGGIERDVFPLRAVIAIPLLAGEDLLGSLMLGSVRPHRFTGEDHRLIEIIGAQLAVAVQNARLHAYARAGKEQWEATFDAIGDLIAVYDHDGRIVRANVALAEHLGRRVTQVQGLSCDAVGLCGAPFPECAVGRAAGIGQCVRSEVSGQHETVWNVTTSPVVNPAGAAAVVQIAKNVTAEIQSARRLRAVSEELAGTNARLVATVDRLKSMQAQLLQAEKLSAIGQLVAGVAHELNNPLTSVIGYAQLVYEELAAGPGNQPPRHASELASDLRRIAEESERAARIVRNLLAFARRQTAARELQDLPDLVSRVLTLRSYDFRLKGIEIETAFEPGLPQVLADAGQIQQALLNLVLNAEQAMRATARPRLRVAARYVPGSACVELSVGDNGHGITDDNLHRIFDPFFTTRDVGEGTGLGLSICYGIVRDHGGQISVDSRADHGATFQLLLPARVDAPAGAPALVAVSDPTDREFIAAAINGWGHRTVMADTAARARTALHDPVSVAFVESAFIDADPAAWDTARRETNGAVVVLTGATDAAAGAAAATAAVLPAPYELQALRMVLRAFMTTEQQDATPLAVSGDGAEECV